MKGFSILAAIMALGSFATAQQFVNTNGTHFLDPLTQKKIKHFGCAVHRGHGGAHFNKTVEELHKKQKESKKKMQGPRAARANMKRQDATVSTPIEITAHFHIIATAANSKAITQDMAQQQMAAMNTAYNPYGISFALDPNVTFTTNDAWSVAGTAADITAMKSALRAGTYKDLNIYFHTDLAGGNLGTCSLPSQVPAGADPSMYNSDGCLVNANTMPGGTMAGYNMGKTAVHETGHWLGLLHTFEGYSCAAGGDLIDDTPRQSQATDGCPEKPPKDSCPTETGVDAIHNYMDYSTDACYEGFTPLQIARIETLWNQFRKDQ